VAKQRKKKRSINSAADRFYHYIMERRDEVFRYITVALTTAVFMYFLQRSTTATGYGILIPFVLRFFAMFYLLKYWAYREKGSGAFYTGRQLMLAIMMITLATIVFYYLTLFVAGVAGHPVFINYFGQLLLEIAYFVIYQFVVFKEPK